MIVAAPAWEGGADSPGCGFERGVRVWKLGRDGAEGEAFCARLPMDPDLLRVAAAPAPWGGVAVAYLEERGADRAVKVAAFSAEGKLLWDRQAGGATGFSGFT
ncbi:MAG: hypothetical protein LBR80_17755, partial [Deltaproteobacteria bacterium]|nr:hypothetical protein [Deltaproteobacteria bacterium]